MNDTSTIETVVGTVEFQRWANRDGTFYVYSVSTDSAEQIKITTTQAAEVGMQYAFVGRHEIRDHGPQFTAHGITLPDPVSDQSTMQWLMHAPGIGPVWAQKLVDRFGGKDLPIVLEDVESVPGLMEMGLGEKKSTELVKWATENRSQRIALQGCIEVLSRVRMEFRDEVTRKAVELWGDRAGPTIKRNPFALHEQFEVPISTCWTLWQVLGLPLNRIKPQAYAVIAFVHGAGNTWSTVDVDECSERPIHGRPETIVQELADKFGSVANPARAMELLIRAGRVVTEERDGVLLYALASDDKLERHVAQLMARRVTEYRETFRRWN